MKTKRIIDRLQAFWFAPAPAERLAILRIGTGGFALWYLLSRFSMLRRMARGGEAHFEAIGLVAELGGPIPPLAFDAVLYILIGLNLLYILGWKFKYIGPLFATLLLLFLTYRNSWAMIYHNRNALVLQVLIIGWTTAADAFSLDALRSRTLKGIHWRYGLPIKLICVATVCTYFVSGVAKVAGDLSWEWATGEALRSQVAVDAIRKVLLGGELEPVFMWIYPYTWVFMVMGITTLILELGAPFALWKKRLTWVWVVLTWLMHWGIFFVMGIRFRYQMTGLIFLAFFDTEKVWFGLKQWYSKNVQRSNRTLSSY